MSFRIYLQIHNSSSGLVVTNVYGDTTSTLVDTTIESGYAMVVQLKKALTYTTNNLGRLVPVMPIFTVTATESFQVIGHSNWEALKRERSRIIDYMKRIPDDRYVVVGSDLINWGAVDSGIFLGIGRSVSMGSTLGRWSKMYTSGDTDTVLHETGSPYLMWFISLDLAHVAVSAFNSRLCDYCDLGYSASDSITLLRIDFYENVYVVAIEYMNVVHRIANRLATGLESGSYTSVWIDWVNLKSKLFLLGRLASTYGMTTFRDRTKALKAKANGGLSALVWSMIVDYYNLFVDSIEPEIWYRVVSWNVSDAHRPYDTTEITIAGVTVGIGGSANLLADMQEYAIVAAENAAAIATINESMMDLLAEMGELSFNESTEAIALESTASGYNDVCVSAVAAASAAHAAALAISDTVGIASIHETDAGVALASALSAKTAAVRDAAIVAEQYSTAVTLLYNVQHPEVSILSDLSAYVSEGSGYVSGAEGYASTASSAASDVLSLSLTASEIFAYRVISSGVKSNVEGSVTVLGEMLVEMDALLVTLGEYVDDTSEGDAHRATVAGYLTAVETQLALITTADTVCSNAISSKNGYDDVVGYASAAEDAATATSALSTSVTAEETAQTQVSVANGAHNSSIDAETAMATALGAKNTAIDQKAICVAQLAIAETAVTDSTSEATDKSGDTLTAIQAHITTCKSAVTGITALITDCQTHIDNCDSAYQDEVDFHEAFNYGSGGAEPDANVYYYYGSTFYQFGFGPGASLAIPTEIADYEYNLTLDQFEVLSAPGATEYSYYESTGSWYAFGEGPGECTTTPGDQTVRYTYDVCRMTFLEYTGEVPEYTEYYYDGDWSIFGQGAASGVDTPADTVIQWEYDLATDAFVPYVSSGNYTV